MANTNPKCDICGEPAKIITMTSRLTVEEKHFLWFRRFVGNITPTHYGYRCYEHQDRPATKSLCTGDFFYE